METRETVRKMTDGQRSDLIATIAGVIPADFSFRDAQAIIGNKGPFVADIRKMFEKRRLSTVPANDVWFDLKVNNDFNPINVVASTRCDTNNWEYLGPKLSGERTYRAKLVYLGYVRNFEEARKKAYEMGYRLVEGQAREPFKFRFPKPDGKGPINFGGSEWRAPFGQAGMAFLRSFRGEWVPTFLFPNTRFSATWRWIVVDK